MSRENVDLIRRAIEAYNRDGIEAVVRFAHPDALAVPFREWPSSAVYRGKAGWAALLREWTENFDDFRWEIDRLVDADDAVVALVRIRARVKGTGIPISQPIGGVFSDFRDDTVAEARFYLTFREALQAADLAA